MKACRRCARTDVGFARNAANADGLQSWCIECAAAHKAYARYGLPVSAYPLFLGVVLCQSCGDTLKTGSGGRAIDHRHGAQIRGVICTTCNFIEGQIESGRVARVAAYLERTDCPEFDWVQDRIDWLEKHNET